MGHRSTGAEDVVLVSITVLQAGLLNIRSFPSEMEL
jgi:hypothetical protein